MKLISVNLQIICRSATSASAAGTAKAAWAAVAAGVRQCIIKRSLIVECKHEEPYLLHNIESIIRTDWRAVPRGAASSSLDGVQFRSSTTGTRAGTSTEQPGHAARSRCNRNEN